MKSSTEKSLASGIYCVQARGCCLWERVSSFNLELYRIYLIRMHSASHGASLHEQAACTHGAELSTVEVFLVCVHTDYHLSLIMHMPYWEQKAE